MKKNILIAENATSMSMFMVKALASEGYEVDVVDDAADAITMLNENKYDLLITDLSIPPCDVGGEGILRAAQVLQPKLKRMIASGSVNDLHSQLAQKRLTKPFNRNQLLDAVSGLV